jgi:hypothetical protein
LNLLEVWPTIAHRIQAFTTIPGKHLIFTLKNTLEYGRFSVKPSISEVRGGFESVVSKNVVEIIDQVWYII